MTLVAVDSNALTYLIEATEPGYDPARDDPTLARERVSMLRIFFYADCDMWVSPTVKHEIRMIADWYRNARHDRFVGFLLLDQPVHADPERIDARVQLLLTFHPKKLDCRILAEAESMDLDALLSFDPQFVRRVRHNSRVRVVRPSEFWSSLGIAPGARPVRKPAAANPLSRVDWWRM